MIRGRPDTNPSVATCCPLMHPTVVTSHDMLWCSGKPGQTLTRSPVTPLPLTPCTSTYNGKGYFQYTGCGVVHRKQRTGLYWYLVLYRMRCCCTSSSCSTAS